MPQPRAHRQAAVLDALAQPIRLHVLDRVAAAGPEGVAAGVLARALRCPASTLSFHLKALSRAGLVEARPSGRFVLYSLRRAPLRDLALYLAGLAGSVRPRRGRRGDGARRRDRWLDAGQLSMFAD